MKQMLRKYMSLVALFSATGFMSSLEARHFKMAPQADPLNLYTGIFEDIHLPDMGGWYTNFAIKGEYRRSFKGGRIADYLFGNALVPNATSTSTTSSTLCSTNCNSDCSGRLLIQGSRVVDRNSNALLADYFGLAPDFSSEVTFCPRIEQGIIDLSAWWGFDNWWCGGWAFVRAPIVWQRARLNAVERVIATGALGYDAGYFTSAAVPRANLLDSFGEFTSGGTPTLGAGFTFDALLYDRFSTNLVSSAATANGGCCNDSADIDSNCVKNTKLGDIHIGIGWDFLQDPEYCYHAGVGLLFVAPTGTRINSNQLFAPQIGNNHHFELGALFTSHYMLWRSCDWDSYLNFHLEAQVSHLFKSCELHTFDICNPNASCNVTDMSQYMLAMQFGTNPATALTQGSTTPAPTPWTDPVVGVTATSAQAVFNNHYAPIANLTSRQFDVSVKAQGYVLAALNYNACNFNGELGYQFYGRSCDNFDCGVNAGYFSSTIPGAWALKGDSYVYGFEVTATTPPPPGSVTATTPRALSATQSQACITGGLNFAGIDPTSAIAINAARANPNIDNAQFAYVLTADGLAILTAQPGTSATNPPGPTDPQQQTRTSIQPVYLSDSNVNIANERSKERTHTLFGSINYHWDYSDCWEPSLGIGARVDFSGKRANCGSSNGCSTISATACGLNNICSDSGNCRRAGLTDWGVWIKFAASFA